MSGENRNRVRNVLSQFFNLIISPYGLFAILGFAVFVALVYGIYSASGIFLNSLHDTETARGLITFLVAFTTVSIALILALYAIVSNVTGQDLKDRFGFAKEILTALIGILGTILGFYFASTPFTTKEATSPEIRGSQALQVAPVFVSNESPKKGDIVVLSSFISGGKPQYIYSILFSPPNFIVPIIERVSSDGVIKEEIKIPESIQEHTEFTFQITIKDSSGKSAAYNDKTKKFLAKLQ